MDKQAFNSTTACRAQEFLDSKARAKIPPAPGSTERGPLQKEAFQATGLSKYRVYAKQHSN